MVESRVEKILRRKRENTKKAVDEGRRQGGKKDLTTTKWGRTMQCGGSPSVQYTDETRQNPI